jgi:16S rRNA (adenine1518-N6/adenine1519-N6)-dimethyltransferase
VGQRHHRLSAARVTLSPTQVTELLARHGVRPSRALGQNFVADPNTVRRIARLAALGPGDRVVEVGPGLGSLTLALAETGATIIAVEADRHLLPVLAEVLTEVPNVTVVHADALSVDWSEVLPGPPGWVMVANLPYNIATPLVADVLDGVPSVERLLVMVQREVGERMCAGPGDPAYGAVSVKVAYWATAHLVGRVPAAVFHPRPRVESILVDIRRRPRPAVDPERVPREALFALVRAGFANRRKMLRRALAGRVDAAQFEAAGVAPESRAEELGVEDWGRLAEAVAG